MKQSLSLFVLYYLRFFAQLQVLKVKLLNPKLKIVGITGSAGKTSCLLACEAALSPNFKVKTNYGGNSESGIPLSLLGLKINGFNPLEWFRIILLCPIKLLTNWSVYDVFLIEMGIDSAKPPKNMDYLLSIIRPDIGVFLNVSSVHLYQFSSIENIAAEKAKLILSLPQTSLGIYNSNDLLVKKSLQAAKCRLVPIKPLPIVLSQFLLPPIYYQAFGVASILGQHLNLSPSQIIANIKANFHLPPGRATIFTGIKHSTIIDSTYNSSPLATKELLSFLKTFKEPRIAVLGDMRELGSISPAAHRQLYAFANKSANIIISIGPETKRYFGPKAKKFLYWWQAADWLKTNLPPSATILVKGSQNTIFLEELVKQLLAKKSDIKLLCRQTPYWLKTKKSFRQLNP